jgi:hypothetical protein
MSIAPERFATRGVLSTRNNFNLFIILIITCSLSSLLYLLYSTNINNYNYKISPGWISLQEKKKKRPKENSLEKEVREVLIEGN